MPEKKSRIGRWARWWGGLSAAALVWYAFLGSPAPKRFEEKYTLPEEISVIESTVPYETRRTELVIGTNEDGSEKKEEKLEKIVKTKNIDFSENFEIKTERYTLDKEEDWLPFRVVGHVVSLPRRLFFFDWDISNGMDEERTKATLAMLEQNKNLKDLTVRINHNEALKDLSRLYNDKKVVGRNNVVARTVIGGATCIFSELWADFVRGDYYNPMTQTVVGYSNVESVIAHEIGHHEDFHRFSSDWEYVVGGAFPPIRLCQEWQASSNAMRIMSKEDDWQFNRYLMPAFMTYVIATYLTMKRMFKKKEERVKGKYE